MLSIIYSITQKFNLWGLPILLVRDPFSHDIMLQIVYKKLLRNIWRHPRQLMAVPDLPWIYWFQNKMTDLVALGKS